MHAKFLLVRLVLCLPALCIAGAVQAANNFDGLYEGTGSLMSGKCPPSQHPRFRVTGNHISAGFGRAQVEADVAADGTVSNSASAVQTTTKGSISGNTLTMSVTTQNCAYQYVLDKRV